MVIFSYLLSKHLLRVLLYSRPWGRERNIKGPCLPPKNPEGRREHGPEGPFFSHLLPLPQWLCPGRGSGTYAQLLVHPTPARCWRGQAPQCVPQSSRPLLPEHPRVCSWSPSYGILFPLSHRPFHVSALWPGPPRSKGRQGKEKVT